MARKKHLINVHTSTGTTAPTGASLYLGEIAVQHTTNDPGLWIKMGTSEASTTYEKFIGKTEITNMVSATSGLVNNLSAVTLTGVTMNNSPVSVTNHVANLGTVITAETQLSTATTGTGNVVGSIGVSNHKITSTMFSAAPADQLVALSAATTAHTANTTAHITATERTRWNNAWTSGVSAYTKVEALSAATTAHTANTTMHITATERTRWNNAWTSGVSAYTKVESLSAATTGLSKSVSDLSAGTIALVAASAASVYSSAVSYTNQEIGKLDSTGHSTDANHYITSVTITDGKISAVGEEEVPAESDITTSTTGNGNVITDITATGHALTLTKGITAATSGQVSALSSATVAHINSAASHVSATDRTTWNGKQDAISDLATIRNNALSGASAYTRVNSLSAATTAHTANTTMHVTAADKTKWNAAVTGVTSAGTGNAFTEYSIADNILTLTKGATYLTTAATTTQGTRADNALQIVSGSTYIDLSAKSGNAGAKMQTATVKQQGVETASATGQGLADAYDVKQYVEGLVTSSVDYKGATATLPTTSTVGDLYITTAQIALTAAQSATGAAQTAETGDFIIARSSGKWDVVQKNLDGAITGTLTADTVTLGSGTHTAKSLANGSNGQVLSISSNKPAWVNASLTDTATTETGHYTPSTSASTKGTTAATANYVKGIRIDSKNHVIDVVTGTVVTAQTQLSYDSGTSVSNNASAVMTGLTVSNHAITYGKTNKVFSAGTADSAATLTGNITTGQVTNLTTKIQTTKVNSATTADSASNAAKVNNHTVESDVPSSAVFTDTATTQTGHYTPSASASTEGSTTGFIRQIKLDSKKHVVGIVSGTTSFTETAVTTKAGTTGSTAAPVLSSIVTGGTKGHELTLNYTNKVNSATTADSATNAATATKVKSALTIYTLNATGGTASTVTFDGSANKTVNIPANTDEHVTAVGNHYTATTATKTGGTTTATAASAVKGITYDGAGHIVGVTTGSVLTSFTETQLSTASTGTGNVVCGLTVSNHKITTLMFSAAPASSLVALSAATTAHTANTTAHITSTERTRWNNAWTSGVSAYTKVESLSAATTAHTANTTAHITSTERTRWNNAWTSGVSAYTKVEELSAGTLYEFKQTNHNIPYVIQDGTVYTGSTSDYTATCNELTELVDGQSIIFCPKQASKSGNTYSASVDASFASSCTLNLTLADGTTTGPKKIYLTNATKITTHLQSNDNIRLIYRENTTFSGTTGLSGWWTEYFYQTDANTLPIQLYGMGRVVSDQAIPYRYSLIMQTSAGTFNSITTTVTTGATSSARTTGFVLGSPIIYYTSGAPANTLCNSAYSYVTLNVLDFRYSSNCTSGASSSAPLTGGKPVYLVGTVGNDGLFYLDTVKWWTQDLPTQEDDKVYIFLGTACNTAQISLFPTHPVYEYKNGHIRQYQEDPDGTMILGPSYTYSGLPFVNSATTIADAYSALTHVVIEDELVVAAALNDLNTRIIENEETVAGALNNLNNRVSVVETHMTGDYIPITGYVTASGTGEEELTLRETDTINEALGKLQKQSLDNEEAIAAGLNDLNQRVLENTAAIARNTGVTALSGAVVSLSTNVGNLSNNLSTLNDAVRYGLSSATQSLSASVASISAKTSGVLTISANGVEQGRYSPSANTTIDLQIVSDVTGADVLLTGYELSSGTTEEELAVVATDTVNEAFGKIQKQNYDNEAIIAGALNDLDERIIELSNNIGTKRETSIGQNGIEPNAVYDLGTLTGTVSFTLVPGVATNIVNHYYWTFETGTVPPTVTWPSGIIKWAGNCLVNGTPSLVANAHYEVSVMNGYAFIVGV